MLGNIFILGDSYSTFEGHIPSEYESYYFSNGPKYVRDGTQEKLNDNDVCKVTHTWWYNLAKENGNLIKNCSWSGTTICNTGYDGADNSEISFIARIEKLIKEGYFEKNRIDTFFLFGGTNDSWADAPIGKEIYSNWTNDDLCCVLPAFSYLIDLLVKSIPDAKIYCIINTELKSEIAEFYKSFCSKNNIGVIELCGINKMHGHPTIKGMLEIKEQVLYFMGLK